MTETDETIDETVESVEDALSALEEVATPVDKITTNRRIDEVEERAATVGETSHEIRDLATEQHRIAADLSVRVDQISDESGGD